MRLPCQACRNNLITLVICSCLLLKSGDTWQSLRQAWECIDVCNGMESEENDGDSRRKSQMIFFGLFFRVVFFRKFISEY